jgi:4-hydroxy 2-oxovalerate aldolase
MSPIRISDSTLRDGNHAIKHRISLDDACKYASLMDISGIDIVEVGHGNGLGASSLQLGESRHSDREMLSAIRKELKHSKLGVHIIPGFGCISRDLDSAIELGVDIIRVASHCTEADVTERHIKYALDAGCETFGVLMMSHMADKMILLEQAKKMCGYGAQAIVLMDSAGCYLPFDVKEKITILVEALDIPIGFHAHNNLGMAIANSIVALESGAKILDGTASGFGAGAGNAAIEVLVAVLQKMGHLLNVDFYKVLNAVELARKTFIENIPNIETISLVSGLYGVFSGFAKPVQKISKDLGVDSRELMKMLGESKIVAGQEDLILEAARRLQSIKD